jgi:L-lactate utilization protein LutB
MDTVYSWHDETIGAKVVEALQKNGFNAVYFPTKKEAVEYLTQQIPQAAAVGVGGSMTLQEIGVLPILRDRGNEILDHNNPALSDTEKMEYRHRQLGCDVFLTSTNAITLDGKMVNVDGAGNRVAAMIFGPKQVMVVVGMNKVVPSVEKAIERIEMYASPMNNKRLNRQNPCVKTGVCMDCQSPARICNVTTIMHRKPSLISTTVILIGENLGY